MADPLDALDYYRLLGVERGASIDAIRDGFHNFALRYHPDRYAGQEPQLVSRASTVYTRGAEAYRVLLDPGSRQRYDDGLQRGQVRLSEAQASRSSRPGRRTSFAPPPAIAAHARPFLQKAEKSIAAEAWKEARLHIKLALGHDPESPLLAERLALVEAKLAGSA